MRFSQCNTIVTLKKYYDVIILNIVKLYIIIFLIKKIRSYLYSNIQVNQRHFESV